MRLLHLSDLHLGKHVCGFPMIEDQRVVLGQVVDMIGSLRVDALLLAGDLYDKASPGVEAVSLLDWFLDAVSGTGAPIYAVAGNHDSPERVAYASSILARHGVYISPVYDGTVAHYSLADEHGDVTFWLVPFLKPATVRPFFPEAKIETYTDALGAVIGACDIDGTTRNVALSHQFVTSGGMGPERTDSELSLGGMDNVDASVYDPFDYVALGHVHRPQRVGREEVRYSGSPLKYSFSEVNDPKGATLVELGAKGEVRVERAPLAPPHDMRKVRGTVEALCDPEVLAAADPEDYLHVTLTDEEPGASALDRLRAHYPNVMQVEYDNALARARGLGEEDAERRESLTPLELFEGFYEAQNGRPMNDAQRTMVLEELANAEAM